MITIRDIFAGYLGAFLLMENCKNLNTVFKNSAKAKRNRKKTRQGCCCRGKGQGRCMIDLRRFCTEPESGGYIDVAKRLPEKNQVCCVKVRYKTEQNGEPIETESIKLNAVYDHSESKWVMLDRGKKEMVEIPGKVIAWWPDPDPSISVEES